MMKCIGAVACTIALMLSALTLMGASVWALPGGGQAGDANNVAFGCDLSFWNVGGGNLNYSLVDFAKMKADGCEFAIMRIGVELTSGTDGMDRAFLQMYKNARAAGVKLGVYFYALAKTHDEAVQDAQWVIEQIEENDLYFEYPIYYDVEDPGSDTRPSHYSLNSAQMTDLCLGWAETLAAAGYMPGVYSTYENVIKLQSSYTDNYEVWYAKVKYNRHVNDGESQLNPLTESHKDMCGMWQYSWYDYEYDGIGLDMLDVDVAYKDYPAITATYGYNNVPKVVDGPVHQLVGAGKLGTVNNAAFGCDLSSWDVGGGSVLDYSLLDFEKMKADGCEFAILRIGYEGAATRKDTMDPSFLQLYQNARAAGLKLGLHFYSLGKSYVEAQRDALWVIGVIEGNNLSFEYPLYYDMTDPGDSASGRVSHASLSDAALTQTALGWAETLEAAGYFPGVHSSTNILSKLQSGYTDYYDVWCAAVKFDRPAGEGEAQYDPQTKTMMDVAGMWQYAWYDYNYDGVGRDTLDVDVAYKNYPAIMAANGYNNVTVDLTALTSDTVTVGDTTVSNVAIGQTVTELKASVDQPSSMIAVYDKDGNAAADTDTVKTGMMVKLILDGNVAVTYTLAVLGDIGGTGEVNSKSIRDLLCTLTGGGELTALQTLAGDFTGDGAVTTADVRRMLSLLVG